MLSHLVYTAEAEHLPPLRIPIPVRLPHDVVAWLDQQAESQSEPRSVVIRRLLRDAMERSKKQERRKRLAKAPQPHSGAQEQRA